MSPDIPAPPKVTVHCANIGQDEWIEVVDYTEKSRLSTLTQVELTLATLNFSAVPTSLLGHQIEISIETPHMNLLLNRASDLSGTDVEEGRRGQARNYRSVFGTVTAIVETTLNPSDRSLLGRHGHPHADHRHGVLFLYHLSVRPRLWTLGQRSRLRVFTDISVPDIVESVLKDGGFLNKKDYKFCLSQSYKKRPFTIQYNETDLAFISRLTEHWGIGFFFEHHNGCDVVVFTDGDQRWEGGQVPVLPFTGTGEKLGLVDLSVRHAQVPGRYILRDYNPDHPTVDWTRSGSLRNGDDGEIIEYCSNFDSMEEGALLLRARLDALSASRITFFGQVAEAVLEVGTAVKITGHPAFDRKTLSLISVELEWKSPAFSGDAPAEFTQRFEAVVTGLNVRPERRTPTPRIDGVVLGMIEEEKDQEYAELDKDGGYRVRLVVDDPETNPQPYAGVRMMQPHAGQGYGFHFPQRPGTEVALSFIDGNPDRPVISGTMPNALNSSPVQSTTAKSNVIRTGGGNEINFQDSKGNERIKLTSPHGNSLIQIGSPNFPNSGITLDTLGASAERAGVGKSLLTPVLDTATQISKSLGRKQRLTSTTDEFEHDWKSLLDTPARVGKAFETVHAVARQMADIQENIRGTGKARIDQYQIRLDQLDRQRNQLSAKLTAFDILMERVWAKYKLPPLGFLTEEIKKKYDNYFEKAIYFRKQISFFLWGGLSPMATDDLKKLMIKYYIEASELREKLYDAIKNDQRYVDLKYSLEKERGFDNNEGRDSVSRKLIDITNEQIYYKIEKEQLENQYFIDTSNLTSIEFAYKKSNAYVGVAASVGNILQTMTILEGLADQRGANVGWNIAPGSLYAPGLGALATGVPPLLDEEPPEGAESYLSGPTCNIITQEFNGRNFVQGWNTAQTEVSSEHALTLSSELRMLQSAKIIAINAWSKETEYLDPAKGLWEKFKDKIKMEGKAAKSVKMAGTLANAPNFLLGFLASPITTAVASVGMVTNFFKKNTLPSTLESPAGTLLLRGENRTLVTSDRHVEIGAPVVDITAKTIKSYTFNDIIMMSGGKKRPKDWSHAENSSSLIQLAKNGSAIIWANNRIEIAYSEGSCKPPVFRSIEPAGIEGAVEAPQAGNSDMTRVLLTNSGLTLQAKGTEKINMTVGEDLSVILNKDSFKITSKDSYFDHSSLHTKINQIKSGKVSIEAETISLKSGETELIISANGITMSGVDLNFNGTKLSLLGKETVALGGQGAVSVKGAQVHVQGSAETSIGLGSSPTMVQGATVMLG